MKRNIKRERDLHRIRFIGRDKGSLLISDERKKGKFEA